MLEIDVAASIDAYRAAVNPARLDALDANGGARVFVKASGAWLEDASGRRFLDMVCGFGAAALGHRHPEVITALLDAIASPLPFTAPHSVPALSGLLGSKLCGLSGQRLGKVYFGNSGAEGIEAALKFAMARTSRAGFLSFQGGFHGFTTGALSLSDGEHLKAPFPGLSLVAHQVAFEDLDDLERRLTAEPVAAVVVEVVQGLGGARPWGASRLRELRALCRRHGALFVLDEVLTGIGRTGEWFAFQRAPEGLDPDIVVVSKALTGGVVPACAVLMTDDVFDAVYASPGRAYVHGSTFEGNLLAMNVGLRVIRVIEEHGLLDRVRALAGAFARRFAELRAEGLGITDVRISGLLMSFQVAGFEHPEDFWGALWCRRLLLEQGVLTLLAPHALSYVNLLPPFTLMDSDVEFFFEQVRNALLKVLAMRPRRG